VRIHLAREHALEFERFDALRQLVHVFGYGARGAFVILRFGKLKQFVRPDEAFVQRANAVDDFVE
jgi:hypothetical protein